MGVTTTFLASTQASEGAQANLINLTNIDCTPLVGRQPMRVLIYPIYFAQT